MLRILGILFGCGLAALVAVQTLALRKASRRLEGMEKRVSALFDEQRSASFGDARPINERRDLQSEQRGFPTPRHNQLAPALGALGQAAKQAGGLAGIVAASDDPLPLPVELSSPQARAQLSDFVRAQIDKEREESQTQRRSQAAERLVQANSDLAQKLGLDRPTAGQFANVLTQSQQQRMDLRFQAGEGTLPRAEVREQMRQISRKEDEQIRRLVGDDRFKQYEETKRADGVPGAGRFGAGFGSPRGGNAR